MRTYPKPVSKAVLNQALHKGENIARHLNSLISRIDDANNHNLVFWLDIVNADITSVDDALMFIRKPYSEIFEYAKNEVLKDYPDITPRGLIVRAKLFLEPYYKKYGGYCDFQEDCFEAVKAMLLYDQKKGLHIDCNALFALYDEIVECKQTEIHKRHKAVADAINDLFRAEPFTWDMMQKLFMANHLRECVVNENSVNKETYLHFIE